MEILNTIVVPAIKTFFYLLIFGGLAFLIIRWIYYKWTRSWKFIIGYTIFRTPYNPKDVEWLMDAKSRGLDKFKVKKELLLAGTSQSRINELLWIFRKLDKSIRRSK